MSRDPDQVTLRIAGARKAVDSVLGWTVAVYELDGFSRGEPDQAARETLAPDAVLELEFANGTRILVAAEDAGRYFGAPARRGGDQNGAITVGPIPRFSGARPPGGISRDGLGAWILKGLRVFRQGPAGVTALIAAGTFQDAQLDHHNGLYRCATNTLKLGKVDTLPSFGDPALVFIHGTASSTEGSFGGLWRNNGYRSRLAAAYNQRLYAFEHRSLTESPVANALALVKTLPSGARLHLVTHSRGGMVGELLARANRVGQEAFSTAEIERFLEHATRVERQGFEEDAERLRELNSELRQRTIQVE